MDLSLLLVEFNEDEIEWRISRSGIKDGQPWAKVLAYVTNRAIMDRLDSVCEIGNWKNEFKEWREKDVLCGISIRLNGDWVTKWDGAQETDVEATKGGFSGSMKRAAVHWGIGRYLYKWHEHWAVFCEDGQYISKIKDAGYFRWDPPAHPGEGGNGHGRTTKIEDPPISGGPEKGQPDPTPKPTPKTQSKTKTKKKTTTGERATASEKPKDQERATGAEKTKPTPTPNKPKDPPKKSTSPDREELLRSIEEILNNAVFTDGQRKSVKNATTLVKDNTSLGNLKKVWEMRERQLEKQMEEKTNG